MAEFTVVIGVEPGRHISAFGFCIGKIFNVAADQSMKTILHPFTSKIAGTANAHAYDEFIGQALIDRIDHLITQRDAELIDSAGCGWIAQGQNAVVDQRDPFIIKFRGDDYLLSAKIINRATAAKKVVAECDLQIAVDEGGHLRRQSRNLAGKPWPGR